MSKLYTSRLLPTACTATSAQTGYPASNALLNALGLPWRAGAATQQDVVIDLGAATTVRGIGISDINADSVVIASSSDAVSYTDRGTLSFISPSRADRFGRRRGLQALNTIARYWRIRIAAGTPSDGLAYWRIGAVHVYGAVTDITAPQYGLRIGTEHAESRERLANGRDAVAAIGNRFDRLGGRLLVSSASATLVIGSLLSELRAGQCWLDLEYTVRSWWSWPIIADSAADEESIDNPDLSTITLSAREVV